jgi:hypothetical protein
MTILADIRRTALRSLIPPPRSSAMPSTIRRR